MSETVDYNAVLADLVRRRDETDRAIAAICTILGVPVPPTSGPSGPGGGSERGETPRAIQSDTFFNMKAPEAVKTFLGMAKRPQTVKEIQEALETGGFISGAKDLYNNLYTAILRLEENGAVVKVRGKWGLADWYPARPKPKVKSDAVAEKSDDGSVGGEGTAA